MNTEAAVRLARKARYSVVPRKKRIIRLVTDIAALLNKENVMLIMVTEPCCKRMPFEPHKEDCYFKRQEMKMEIFIQNLLRQFKQALKG